MNIKEILIRSKMDFWWQRSVTLSLSVAFISVLSLNVDFSIHSIFVNFVHSYGCEWIYWLVLFCE